MERDPTSKIDASGTFPDIESPITSEHWKELRALVSLKARALPESVMTFFDPFGERFVERIIEMFVAASFIVCAFENGVMLIGGLAGIYVGIMGFLSVMMFLIKILAGKSVIAHALRMFGSWLLSSPTRKVNQLLPVARRLKGVVYGRSIPTASAFIELRDSLADIEANYKELVGYNHTLSLWMQGEIGLLDALTSWLDESQSRVLIKKLQDVERRLDQLTDQELKPQLHRLRKRPVERESE